jgi:hypothetical protein
MNLLANINGAFLAIVMILSYCAVLKNTKHDEHEQWQWQRKQNDL